MHPHHIFDESFPIILSLLIDICCNKCGVCDIMISSCTGVAVDVDGGTVTFYKNNTQDYSKKSGFI